MSAINDNVNNRTMIPSMTRDIESGADVPEDLSVTATVGVVSFKSNARVEVYMYVVEINQSINQSTFFFSR